ncbi:aminopeptidase [Candidatus Heimdallarchaeota archaeon B3_Heim]|nr:MAG: aminopeptidase [Candidatus Heimdallarchaeota archaeon B3_Heim]
MKARDLGIPFEGQTGKYNSITDVSGVEVGHCTLIEGKGNLIVGKGPIRTGVTAIFPYGKKTNRVYAAIYSYNGNGEMTGSHWINESGQLKGPICLTNTHSVGVVRDAIIQWRIQNNFYTTPVFWGLPVVAETYDGILNDINGFHIKKEHVFLALDEAQGGPVKEGSVGGGTGMICHGFKGGVGTSSRRVGNCTIGIYVQANYGVREHLTIAGVPAGKELTKNKPKISLSKGQTSLQSEESGSIIAVIATDAPLLPYQLKRMVKRVPAGLARVGGYGGHTSGDIFLAFSTANIISDSSGNLINTVKSLVDNQLSPFFKAIIEATEEAIINALVNAETMTGINDNIVYALPHDELLTILRKYNRIIV